MKPPDDISFPTPGSPISIHKLDSQGQPVLTYQGKVLACGRSSVTLQASFGGEPITIAGISLKPGDRFIEHFFVDRWYNVFEIYDKDDHKLKGWYCNISRPAVVTGESVAADDLALDLLVKPDGEMVILDQDEFSALGLPPEEGHQSLKAFKELQALALAGKLPHTDTVIEKEASE